MYGSWCKRLPAGRKPGGSVGAQYVNDYDLKCWVVGCTQQISAKRYSVALWTILVKNYESAKEVRAILKFADRMTSNDMHTGKVPTAKSWLPRPPPTRRRISIEAVELANCGKNFPELRVPVRQVDLWSTQNRTAPTMQSYFENQCLNSRDPGTSNKLSMNGEPRTPPGQELYLFHCCANEISPALVRSFSKRGPSIHFARRNGYFSSWPAVYWTNSLDFAFAWGVFTATGRWVNPCRHDAFECIIYVSRVDMSAIYTPSGMYFVSEPTCMDDEQRLVEWCNTNTLAQPGDKRVPPPLSTKSDWSIIGSRIPRHTIDGMQHITVEELPAVGRMDLESTWIYAACDEVSSIELSKCAVEILHIVSNPTAVRGNVSML